MRTPTFTDTSTTMMKIKTMTSKELTAPDPFNRALHPPLTTQVKKLKSICFLKNKVGCPKPL